MQNLRLFWQKISWKIRIALENGITKPEPACYWFGQKKISVKNCRTQRGNFFQKGQSLHTTSASIAKLPIDAKKFSDNTSIFILSSYSKACQLQLVSKGSQKVTALEKLFDRKLSGDLSNLQFVSYEVDLMRNLLQNSRKIWRLCWKPTLKKPVGTKTCDKIDGVVYLFLPATYYQAIKTNQQEIQQHSCWQKTTFRSTFFQNNSRAQKRMP